MTDWIEDGGEPSPDEAFERDTRFDHLIPPLPEPLRQISADAAQRLFSKGTTDVDLLGIKSKEAIND